MTTTTIPNYPIRYKDYISDRPAGVIGNICIAGTNGPEFAIRVSGQAGDGQKIDFVLFANAVKFVAEFEPMVNRMKRTLSDARHAEMEAIMHGQATAPQVERFSRGRQRSNGDADPLELRAHPYDWLTIDRLTGNPDIDMGLIGLRYPWLSYTIDPRHIAAAERYLAGDEAAADPFEADVAQLRAMPQEELTKTDGSLNLSAVARAVGRRTGGSDWAYVQELAAALGELWQRAA